MKTYIVDISFKYYKIDNNEGYYISLIIWIYLCIIKMT
jgi:hypothetical protein